MGCPARLEQMAPPGPRMLLPVMGIGVETGQMAVWVGMPAAFIFTILLQQSPVIKSRESPVELAARVVPVEPVAEVVMHLTFPHCQPGPAPGMAIQVEPEVKVEMVETGHREEQRMGFGCSIKPDLALHPPYSCRILFNWCKEAGGAMAGRPALAAEVVTAAADYP